MAKKKESYVSYLKAAEPRFWRYVDRNGPLARGMTSRCWQWQGATDGNYGEFGVPVEGEYPIKYAHFFTWVLSGGPIPSRYFPLHHLCGNKLCVNPNHIAMVTHAGHARLHIVMLSATCPNGHAFDEVNTLIDGKGYRRCRECARESRKRHNEMRRKK
jgi:hypothetical protein